MEQFTATLELGFVYLPARVALGEDLVCSSAPAWGLDAFAFCTEIAHSPDHQPDQ